MERITAAHFVYRPDQKPAWLDTVRVYTPDGARWPQTGDEYPGGGMVLQKPLTFEFEGNRIDVIAMPTTGPVGSAKILIDGQAPSKIPQVYSATRPTLIPASPWPYLKCVQVGGQPVEEEWTLTYTKVAPRTKGDGKPDNFEIEFDLAGSITGPDGHGSTRERFVSNSGRITLEPDWFLPIGFWPSTTIKQPKAGTTVQWRTKTLAMDTLRPRPNLDPALEDRHVLAQGLFSGKHTLEILPNNDGPVALRAIIVHQPPTGQHCPRPAATLPGK